MTHKPFAERLMTEYRHEIEKMGALVGWWGAHERGHNEWTGRHMVIFGGTFTSGAEQASRYESARVFALSAGAAEADWPAWDDEVTEGLWISEGTHEVQCLARLPSNPVIRRWLLADYCAAIVQAIGRARGVWMTSADPCEIHVYGGLPIVGLAEYGLSIDEYRDDPGGWRTVDSHNRAQSADSRSRILIAVEALQAVGGKITFRGVNGFLHAENLPGLSPRAYTRLVREMGLVAAEKMKPEGFVTPLL